MRGRPSNKFRRIRDRALACFTLGFCKHDQRTSYETWRRYTELLEKYHGRIELEFSPAYFREQLRKLEQLGLLLGCEVESRAGPYPSVRAYQTTELGVARLQYLDRVLNLKQSA